ncbi:MAG: hypothetical protein NT075_00115 [Chloroflexi bacterium]|nr:hypothetical protein [Chloroflexota bacterium]
MTTALATVLALAFWSVLLAWLHGFGIKLSPERVFLITGLGWGIFLIRYQVWKTNGWTDLTQIFWADTSRIVLWFILLASMGVSLYVLRNTVAALGSDGFHHTLLAQTIAEQGGLPDNLLPLTSVASFTYHFGFHGFVATIIWLTGLSAITLTPILAQILIAVAALEVAFFVETVTHKRKAAPISAAIVGLMAVFPAYFVNWSRDTQLTGLLVSPVILALVWQWTASQKFDWRSVPVMALLAAGMALSHYRVAVLTVIGFILIVIVNVVMDEKKRIMWLQLGLRLLALGGLTGLFVAAWGWHVLKARQLAYPVVMSEQLYQPFTLSRWNDHVLYYPTNIPLLILLALALTWGWWRRERLVIALSVWGVVAMWLSGPHLLNIYMDNGTVFASSYVPVAVLVGWFGATVLEWLALRFQPLYWLGIIGLCALTAQGAIAAANIVEPDAAYVQPADLRAMAWISRNTPDTAYFMVNTLHFGFWPDYVIGSDAGFWLPVLAKRKNITAPMSYPIERNIQPDYAAQTAALDQLQGDLTSPTALMLLEQAGITYIYVGARGGIISVQKLLDSPVFKLEFHDGSAYVFRFLGTR